jgi:hypothetical protein
MRSDLGAARRVVLWMIAVVVAMAAACLLIDAAWRRSREATVSLLPQAVPAAAPVAAPPPVSPTPRQVMHQERPEVVEAPAIQPKPLDAQWTGEVRGRDAMPVAGADVFFINERDEVVTRLAATATGTFALPCKDDLRGRLIVRHPSFAVASLSVARADAAKVPPPVIVTLDEGAAIEGDVVLPSGQAPAGPVRVAAHPLGGGSFTTISARQATEDHPLMVSTVTDRSGRFRLPGLRPGQACTLLAAGRGCAQVTENSAFGTRAIAGGERARIVVAPSYVLDLRPTGPSGAPILASPLLRTDPPSNWTGNAGCLRVLAPADPTLQWAEIEGLDAALERGTGRTYCVMLGSVEAERIGPYRFHALAPGYRPVDCDVWAIRTGIGLPTAQEVRMEQVAGGFGRAMVLFDDRGTGLAEALRGTDTSCVLPAFHLRLMPTRPAGDGARALSIPLRSWPTTPLDVDGVPAGRYRVMLDARFAADAETTRAHELEVVAMQTTEVRIEFLEWSAVEVTPVTGDPPERYSGPLSITLRLPGTSVVSMYTFARPPYRVVGVAPRAYDVDVRCVGRNNVVARTEAANHSVTTVDVRLPALEGSK